MRILLPAIGLLLLASAGCEDRPAWCTPRALLDATCAGPQCVASVVIDYQRLEPRGYRIFALAGTPIDREAAEQRAIDYLAEINAEPAESVDVDVSGDFYNCFLRYPTNDSWLIIIHAPTGQVIFAGLETWADPVHRGHDFPLPAGYTNALPLGCTDDAAEPESKKLVTTGVPTGSAPASTASQAWGVAQRLNLTSLFTAGHRYRAMVVSYSPAVGEFDPASADWLVWMYRL